MAAGCETAGTDPGRLTMRLLRRIVGLPVYGSRQPLLSRHSSAGGFDDAFLHLLVEASNLPAGRPPTARHAALALAGTAAGLTAAGLLAGGAPAVGLWNMQHNETVLRVR
jgi:hypothetical protein